MNALVAYAETAQDIAAGLDKFLGPVPDYATEITALISECFAISSALRELSTAIGDSRHNRRYHQISEDIRITLQSLEYTFNDVRSLFGGLGRGFHIPQSTAYRSVWREITVHFVEESGSSLCRRLETYRRFLLVLVCVVEGLAAHLQPMIDIGHTVNLFLEIIQIPMNMRICNIVSRVFSQYRMTCLQMIWRISRWVIQVREASISCNQSAHVNQELMGA